MRAKITNELVRKLKPAVKEYEVRDTEVTGLILRVKPTGKMVYTLVYKRGKRLTIGNADAITPYQARELAKSELAKVYQGTDPINEKKKLKADSYLQYIEVTYKPWLEENIVNSKTTLDNLKKLFPEFHNKRLCEISTAHIEKWRTGRLKEEIKPSAINRQLNDLRACLNRAAEWGLIETQSLPKIKACKTDSNPKIRYLTEDEERDLRTALDEREARIRAGRQSNNHWREERSYSLYIDLSDHAFADYLKPAVLLSLNTGLRRGELFGLKWSDIDLDEKTKNLTVVGETAKSGKTRHIPLNDEALAILKQWKDQPGIKSPYIFHGRDGKRFQDLRKSWIKVLEQAGIADFRWHDLRHSFASKLVMAGVDLNTIRELLGHHDYKMTLRYAHLAPKHKAAAVALLVKPQEVIAG